MEPINAAEPTSQKQRRRRVIASCTECYRRKLRCDRMHPCTNCEKSSRNCVYSIPPEIPRRTQSTSKQHPSQKVPDSFSIETTTSQSNGRSSGDDKVLRPLPFAVVDTSYEDDVNDDALDLGIRIGRMRMTERLGGLFRPKISEELNSTLQNSSSDRRTDEEKADKIPQLLDNQHDYLDPGPTYINLGSDFMLGGVMTSLNDTLPSKDLCDTLVNIYHENVHFVARVVHWPSFQSQYDDFWAAILAGLEPTPSQQALVLAVLFSAVVSMSNSDLVTILGHPKDVVQLKFQQGTEAALVRAQFLRTTKIETMQAWVLYLIPMCRDQMSRAHSALVGTAVRVGECMGLHRDPADVHGLPAIENHVRRMLWFQLCFLDFRTGEIQGPRPCIKHEDYDVKFPLNIDDVDLLNHNHRESNTRFTDMTLSRIRFECIELQRTIYYDRIRLEKKEISLTSVLGKIESFRKTMQAKYVHILDPSIPIQYYAECCLKVLLSRMHIMILHRYLHDVGNKVPERLHHLVLSEGVTNLEAAYQLETADVLKKWTWYNGAHHQWHTALLMLKEVYSHPHLQQADRIWKVLDFAFQTDPSHSRAQKGRAIMSTVKARSEAYRNVRRMRIPLCMRSEGIWRSCKLGSTAVQESQPQPTFLEQESAVISSGNVSESDKSPSSSNATSSNKTSQATSVTNGLSRNNSSESTSIIPNSPGQIANQLLKWGINQQSQSNVSVPSDQLDLPAFESNSLINGNAIPETWDPLACNDQGRREGVQQSMTTPSLGNPILSMNQAAFSETDTYSTESHPSLTSGLPLGSAAFLSEDQTMLDVDWSEWDKLFPIDEDTGDLNIWST